MRYSDHTQELNEYGFSVISELYTASEVDHMLKCIESQQSDNQNIQKDLFAIRRLLDLVPELSKTVFNSNLKRLLCAVFKRGNLNDNQMNLHLLLHDP